MRSLFIALFGLTLTLVAPGCSTPPSTFGLRYRYSTDGKTFGSGCQAAGNSQGGTSGRLDTKGPFDDPTTLPHLWFEVHQDGDDAPYTLEVFTVSSYRDSTMLPAEKQTLKSTTYDEAFGEAARTDTFQVSFEQHTYSFEITGLPKGTACPADPTR